jgi:2-polyprenyl-3-methyl-5-hydroxy-6-metoxy-1,4-benzoquinol methylase
MPITAFLTTLILLSIVLFVWSSDKPWMFQTEAKWDLEWSNGEWDYMDKVSVERSKNSIIGSVLVPMYTPRNASVLDIGCGIGAISDFLNSEQRMHYVGVDISKEAVVRAKERRKETGHLSLKYVHSNVYDFTPTHAFDVIVFSDVLYYVDSEKVLEKYATFLQPNGLLIVSIFSNSFGKTLKYHEHIFESARKLYKKIDELDVGGWTKKKVDGKSEKTAFHLEVYRRKQDDNME